MLLVFDDGCNSQLLAVWLRQAREGVSLTWPSSFWWKMTAWWRIQSEYYLHAPPNKLIDSVMSTSSAIRASSSTALFMTRAVGGGGEDPVGRQSKVSVEGSGRVEANGSAAATGGGAGADAGEGVPLAGKAWYS